MNKKLVIAIAAIITVVAGFIGATFFFLNPLANPVPPVQAKIVVSPLPPTATLAPTVTATALPTATATATPTPIPPTATPKPSPTPMPTATPRPPFKSLFTFDPGDKVQQLRPGVIHIQRLAKGPLRINVLLFDLTAKELELRVAPAKTDTLGNVARTSIIADNNKALAAVNGDEFTYATALPQGMMLTDGKLFMAPKYRATFGWTKDRQPYIGYFTQDWTWPSEVIAANGGKRSLQLLNTPCEQSWLCVYNEYYKNIPARYGELRVVLDENYQVVSIKEDAAIKILPGQTVLVGRALSNTWLRENVNVGDSLNLRLVTNPDYRNFTQAVSGGPIMLDKGRFVQDCLCDLRDCGQAPAQYKGLQCEEFPTDWKLAHYLTVRMPRIGVAYDQNKTRLIVISVDGYQPGYSIGMTQKELSELMLEFGGYSGMELDGGGSATMWLEDRLISKPSDGGGSVERSVANALLFFWNETPVPFNASR